jgi:CheY-like chemotaxis protein
MIPSTSPPSARGLRVLVVDDHADTCTFLSRFLSRAGHQVSVCGSLAAARAALRGEGAGRQHDLLICDLTFPDGTGWDLMREAVPLGVRGIAVTGLSQPEERDQSRAAGFADHLVKPIQWEALAAAIDRAVAGE